VIPGEEVSTECGDLLAFFIQEEVKSHEALEVIDEVKEQDGLIVIAHPYKYVRAYPPELLKRVDGIEIFNARNPLKNLTYIFEMMKGHEWALTAGSDAHFYFEIGRAYIELNEPAHEPEDVKKAILRGELSIAGTITHSYAGILSRLVGSVKTCDYRPVLKLAINGMRHIVKKMLLGR